MCPRSAGRSASAGPPGASGLDDARRARLVEMKVRALAGRLLEMRASGQGPDAHLALHDRQVSGVVAHLAIAAVGPSLGIASAADVAGLPLLLLTAGALSVAEVLRLSSAESGGGVDWGEPLLHTKIHEMVAAATRHRLQWRWVRGHNGDIGNERADVLANKGVEVALGRLPAPM